MKKYQKLSFWNLFLLTAELKQTLITYGKKCFQKRIILCISQIICRKSTDVMFEEVMNQALLVTLSFHLLQNSCIIDQLNQKFVI